MAFIYDLFLNFNKDLWMFYEWHKDDYIIHIKKINLIKVDMETYNDFMNNHITFDKEFLDSIYNKCEYFYKNSIKKIAYALLVSDSFRSMALLIDSNGNIIKYSSLLLDVEEEVLEVSSKLPVIKIMYHKNDALLKRDLTRDELDVQNFIIKEINYCYKHNNISKLKYLYYEYFEEQLDDIDKIYSNFMNELKLTFNNKLYNLFNVIKLSYSQKSV